MKFKYRESFCQINPCPPTDAAPGNIKGFRFVFKDRDASENFLPVGIIDPSRAKPKLFEANPSFSCSLFALSFFITQDQARIHFEKLVKNRKSLRKKLGDSIASLDINVVDGVVTKPNIKSGHFDFHPIENCSIHTRQSIVEELI